MRKTSLLLLLFFFSAFLLPTALLADEVFLRGAGSISGRIVEQTDTTVMVDIGGGTIGVAMSRVDHIVKSRTDLDEYDTRASRLARWDVNAWRDLARWATRHDLDRQAGEAYEKVLAIEPDDPEAQGALGFVLLDGNWVTKDEAYRARGFVKYDGEWMMPTEAQMRLDSAAADQARWEADERARKEELEKLKEDVKAQYAAEAARDEEWRAEGAAWFYSRAYSGFGWGYGPTFWPGSYGFHHHSSHGQWQHQH